MKKSGFCKQPKNLKSLGSIIIFHWETNTISTEVANWNKEIHGMNIHEGNRIDNDKINILWHNTIELHTLSSIPVTQYSHVISWIIQ